MYINKNDVSIESDGNNDYLISKCIEKNIWTFSAKKIPLPNVLKPTVWSLLLEVRVK